MSDRSSGGGSFLAKKGSTIYKCVGAAPQLKKNTPVVITGHFDEVFSTIFHVENIRLNDTNRTAMVKFLKGRSFSGINEEKAKKIYDTLIFVASREKKESICELPFEVIVETITSIGLDETIAKNVAIEFTGLESRISLFNWIKAFGGTYADAEKAFDVYSGAAKKILEKDPYKGVECGIPFKTCDKIAYKSRVSKWDKSRIQAILSAVADSIESSGCCCERQKTIIDTAARIQRSSAYSPISTRYLLLAIASSNQFVVKESEQYGLLIYPRKLYQIEQNITNELKRLMSASYPTGYDGYKGDALDCDQVKATSFVEKSGVYVLTGGPGTGKTTTIKTLIYEYHRTCPYDSIYLCAPTGRAAVRITESINDPAYKGVTLHRLIGIRLMDNGYEATYNKGNPLPKGLFIADEMSMTDEKIFLQFLQAIPSGSTVVLSGDPAQLQSVSAGSVLKDLIASEKIPCVFLNQIHRQAEGNTIVSNYYHLRDKDNILEEDGDFIVERYKSSQEILDRAVSLYNSYKDDTNPFDTQILAFTRKGIAGKESLDRTIQATKTSATDIFCLKDKVMMIENNYHTGYYNGDIGTVNGFDDTGIYVKFQSGDERLIQEEDLYDMEHAWACTVHKAQGSEFKTAIIVIDDEFKTMLYTSILLTAITRAKERVIIICKDNALNLALTVTKENERVTGLSEMLK